MAHVFVSYASEDRERVLPLVESLQERGFTVWWDTRIDAGSRFDREIERELDAASCVLVVWSHVSIESDWVREEASEGLRRNILIPLRIDDCRPPLGFRRVQSVFVRDTSTLAQLTDRIQELLRRPSTNSTASKLTGPSGEVSISIRLSGSASAKNIAPTLRDEVSGLLAKVGWLRVVPDEVVRSNYQVDVRIDPTDSGVRLSCRLVDSRTAAEISTFSKTYGQLATFISKSSRICSGIVSALLREVFTAERKRLELVPDQEATCWELCVKSGSANLDTREGQRRAEELLCLSLEQDPSHAQTRSLLAFLFAYSANVGTPGKLEPRRAKAREHLEKALSLERQDPMVLQTCVTALLHLGEIDRASELGDALYTYFPVWGWTPIAALLAERKEYADALELLEEHRTYHPEPLLMKSREAVMILLLNGKFEEACRVALRLATFESGSFVNWALYANALGSLGRREDSLKAWSRAKDLAPGLSVERWHQAWSTQFHNPEVSEVLTEGLKKIGFD